MAIAKSGEELVILGDTAFAEIAYEYFTHDSPYTVAAFSVDRAYLKKEALFGLPVVPFEDLAASHPPARFRVFTAMTYFQMNRVRTRFYAEAKARGYRFASFVSPHAFVWRNVEMGENCFIFENNVIQPFVKIGDNVILWSGNHIGHHSTIGSHCFIASHVVISGFCEIGESCFFGVNATVANNVKVARDCLVGAGATILKDTAEARIYATRMTEARETSSLDVFKARPPGAR
jgi:sugar O-acyltransferase (sialic acid O-acetyltransferase NeuD family)